MPVVSMKGDEIFIKGEPREDVVAMLTDILEMVKRGELHGAHMVLVHDDGVSRKACVGRCNYSTIGCLTALTNVLLTDCFDP